MLTKYPGAGNVSFAFPTPLYQRVMPGYETVNPELTRIILEHEKESVSLGRSNVGGWHSGDDLLEWPYPEIDALKGWIGEAVGEITNMEMEGRLSQDHDVNMDGGAWVNLCRNGDYNTIHNHPACSWSGVYYVSLGNRDPSAPEQTGQIEFLDPRMGATAVGLNGPDSLPKMRIEPVAGMMLVFPSWLYHCVNPFIGTGERISISFNVSLRFEG
ncbi:MAG: hypothetical protein CMM52_08685 [Rhodospirillaceae bacterium]|nr:hypothetical protein [Rhodospirillaceae bacterium]|tara:strand:- start:15196 stop:15837 length:642 start_codon:yes stop_codon:yes gene_type:complete